MLKNHYIDSEESFPGILTVKKSLINEKGFNIINLHEYYPFQKSQLLPDLFKRFLIRLFNSLNKYNVFIGTRLFFNKRKFDVIISGNIKQAMFYSFLGMIFPWNKKLHILNEIYLNEPTSLRRKIRPLVYRLFLRNIDFIRVSARNEISNYSGALKIDRNRFWFNPWPTPVPDIRLSETEGDYILSAGKQFRDYHTLVSAVSGTGHKLIIVSDKNSMSGIEISDEVTVIYNISKKEYLEILLKSKFVVVPLNNDFCSCGQIAFLEAMSVGKPVIVTRVTGSIDYIEEGETGLFYTKGDIEDLRQKINLLSANRDLRVSLAREAATSVSKGFNNDVFSSNYNHFITGRIKLFNE